MPPPIEKRCYLCDEMIPFDAAYCPHCGAAFGNTTQAGAWKKTAGLILLSIIATLMAVGGGCNILLNGVIGFRAANGIALLVLAAAVYTFVFWWQRRD